MLVVGSCAAVANGSIAAVFQATVAPEYQGRVFCRPESERGDTDPHTS